MKKIKKMMTLMIALAMAMAMGITVFAQTAALNPADADNATITINNPAKGETYTIYKLFDATVSKSDSKEIAYQCVGEIPTEVAAFFTKDGSNNVIPDDSIVESKDNKGNVTATKMTAELKTALENWAKTATETNHAVSEGDKLEFTGLPYGYYVITTTHESDVKEGEETAKAAITVASTQPNASIYDKNVNKPNADKKVEKESYSIGDTVKYTATFDTTNFMGEGESSKQVVKYLIKDTLPEYLSEVKITKITIGGVEYKVDDAVPQFDNKQIEIPWATGTKGNYQSIYGQGAKIVMTYEAKLTSVTNVGAADTNTVSIKPFVDDAESNEPKPWDEEWNDTAEITTYAAAIKKVDQNDNPLPDAEFKIQGLTVEEVKKEDGSKEDGVYRVVSYDPASTAMSISMSTDDEGNLYIVGLAKDVTLSVTEFKAPDGYNKLTDPVTLEMATQILKKSIYETSGTRHYDKDGNLISETSVTTEEAVTVTKNLSDLDAKALKIENKKGSLLPSTGGIGTTIFYVVGALLVIGAGVLLVAKKRMSREA